MKRNSVYTVVYIHTTFILSVCIESYLFKVQMLNLFLVFLVDFELFGLCKDVKVTKSAQEYRHDGTAVNQSAHEVGVV